MLVESAAEDIVYSSLFSGVPANYLKASVAKSGLDPDNLPSADKSTMSFGSGGNTEAKVWRDIWGAGHGTGSIRHIPSMAECIAQLRSEYDAAYEALQGKRF
jgi:nitronate monooxygenase